MFGFAVFQSMNEDITPVLLTFLLCVASVLQRAIVPSMTSFRLLPVARIFPAQIGCRVIYTTNPRIKY